MPTVDHPRRDLDLLVDEFDCWLTDTGEPDADAEDLWLLLEWKRGQPDGDDTSWRCADVERFLLEYCPARLTISARDAETIPASVVAAVGFLAELGMAAGSDSRQQLVRHALSCRDEFFERMADPAYFDTTKSLIASAGGLNPDFDPSDPGAVDELVARINGLPKDQVGAALQEAADELEPVTIGPVRMPPDDELAASAAAAPVFGRFQQLHDACAGDGLALTTGGELTGADADRLAGLLDTGATGLGRWLEWALKARVVRRYGGRLVQVRSWTGPRRNPMTALHRVVDALLEIGPVSRDAGQPDLVPLAMFVEDGVGRVLAELLDAGSGQRLRIDTVGELVVATTEVANQVMPMAPDSMTGTGLAGVVTGFLRDLFDRLAECGVVHVDEVRVDAGEPGVRRRTGGTVELTPAGVPVAVRLVEELGLQVVERPDPAATSAAQLVDLLGVADQAQWHGDVTVWAAGREPAEAAVELVAAIAEPNRDEPTVLSGLEMLHGVFGLACTPAVRSLLGGPRDPIAVLWLSQHGELDPATIEPERMIAGGVALLTAVLDIDGPDGVVQCLSSDQPRDVVLQTVEHMWRSSHPRTDELLTAIGQAHPDRGIAKAARKAGFKHRSRAT